MSLVKGKYYLDPLDLDPEDREHRLRVHQAIVREVAAGRCDGSIGTMLQTIAEGGDLEDAHQKLDLLASDQMTGRWTVVSEEWQGLKRDHLFIKALYVDDCACLVVGDAVLGAEEVEVDSIWLSLEELKALQGLA
jgi:hypothetical protein